VNSDGSLKAEVSLRLRVFVVKRVLDL